MKSQPSSPPRVAVVEDDDDLRDLVVCELRDRGCEAIGLDCAEALYRHLIGHQLDLVVLDVTLPGESGIAVASHLRHHTSLGIILISGRFEKATLANGAGETADLFLSKPLDYDLLAAAVLGLHRRLGLAPLAHVKALQNAEAWALCNRGWSLRGPYGKALPLSSAERAVLSHLFERAGIPVSKDALIAAITDQPWDYDPHRLSVLMHRLRTRVASAFGIELPLRAVRGVGFVLTP